VLALLPSLHDHGPLLRPARRLHLRLLGPHHPQLDRPRLHVLLLHALCRRCPHLVEA
ncbi:hypothetical protein BGZ52_000581, partial [Haplosporangium bisporale]